MRYGIHAFFVSQRYFLVFDESGRVADVGCAIYQCLDTITGAAAGNKKSGDGGQDGKVLWR